MRNDTTSPARPTSHFFIHSNLATCEPGGLITQHRTSLPTFWWFCFRLQSDSFRRLLVPPEKQSPGTSHQPFATATQPRHLFPKDGAASGAVGGEQIWPLQMLSPRRGYNTCAHTLSCTHKAGETDDIHTKSQIPNTNRTPAPWLI